MDPLQSNLSEQDRNKLIETYGGDDKFKNLLKNIFDKGTGKKVENFLQEYEEPDLFGTGPIQAPDPFPTQFMGGPKVAHDYDKDPEIIKNIYEIINNPIYDKDSRKEAQRQLLRINQGLPRFPKA
tara:strand:- start:147 stop:521 length:375 start_codon:yes stop_codon:yes gene_type:complete